MKCRIGHDDRRCLYALLVAVQTGDFQAGLIGFGSRIAEKGLVHAGKSAQRLAKCLLLRDVIEITDMQQLFRLGGNCLGYRGIGVAQGANGNSGQGVDVFAASFVP